METQYLTITEMAKIHKLTRQTLIHYDHIGLFKPAYIGENEYRYYSPHQIPYLREICFLKSLGVSLDTIKDNLKERNPGKVMKLLEAQKKKVDEEITRLNHNRSYLQQRINLYEIIENADKHINQIDIITLPERKAVFIPFETTPDKRVLHLTLMKTWNIITSNNMLPSNGFGTTLSKEALFTDNIYENAGTFILLSHNEKSMEHEITFPKGTYARMYKYGMPYDPKDIKNLMIWIDENNYEIVGDAVDLCMLDTTFYCPDHNVDLCCLQIPISKKSI
jgi:DNA-binding transcriptional MerR regulator